MNENAHLRLSSLPFLALVTFILEQPDDWEEVKNILDYPYYWRVRTRFPERKGSACRVLARGSLNSCLVEFEDGLKIVTSRNYLRIRKSNLVQLIKTK